jgi:hypothetical protein
MIHIRNILAVVLLASVSTIFAQSSEVSIQSPPPPKYVGTILKPFHLERRVVAPAKLTNSPRLESLVRGGNLYLSVQDVIALALGSNLDIAVCDTARSWRAKFCARKRRTAASGHQ